MTPVSYTTATQLLINWSPQALKTRWGNTQSKSANAHVSLALRVPDAIGGVARDAIGAVLDTTTGTVCALFSLAGLGQPLIVSPERAYAHLTAAGEFTSDLFTRTITTLNGKNGVNDTGYVSYLDAFAIFCESHFDTTTEKSNTFHLKTRVNILLTGVCLLVGAIVDSIAAVVFVIIALVTLGRSDRINDIADESLSSSSRLGSDLYRTVHDIAHPTWKRFGPDS